ncbi:hypothetical protein ACFPJ1_39750 [Kribbella qitaiheensis]|uniref:hypothetical protein n=1 Tax=Kribbella qitaiheensis TaxID=1544730 RepID=UPI003614DB02
MTPEIKDLLAGAADDTDRPLHHSIDDVVRRGRRSLRLRRAGVVAAGAITAGAVVAGVTTWSDGNPVNGVQPASPPAIGELLPLQPPPSSLTDAQIIKRCEPQDKQWQRGSRKAGGGTGSITGWKVAVSQAKGAWFRAILLSPDRKSWAFCQHNAGTGAPGDNYLREDLKWQQAFEVWTDRDGAEGTVPKNVAAVDFEIDGIVSPATVQNGFLLWYAELTPTDVRDKPIWAIYYDVNGRELARFDSNVYNPWEGYNADRQPVYPK